MSRFTTPPELLYYPDLETGVVFATCSTALDQFFAYLTHLRNLENFDGVDRMLLEHAFEYDVFFCLWCLALRNRLACSSMWERSLAHCSRLSTEGRNK